MKAVQARCPRIALAVWLGKWSAIKDVPQQTRRYHPKAPATSGALGWSMESSAVELMGVPLRLHCFLGDHVLLSTCYALTPIRDGHAQAGRKIPGDLFTRMWIGRSNQIAVHAKEKAPKDLFYLATKSRIQITSLQLTLPSWRGQQL